MFSKKTLGESRRADCVSPYEVFVCISLLLAEYPPCLRATGLSSLVRDLRRKRPDIGEQDLARPTMPWCTVGQALPEEHPFKESCQTARAAPSRLALP